MSRRLQQKLRAFGKRTHQQEVREQWRDVCHHLQGQAGSLEQVMAAYGRQFDLSSQDPEEVAGLILYDKQVQAG